MRTPEFTGWLLLSLASAFFVNAKLLSPTNATGVVRLVVSDGHDFMSALEEIPVGFQGKHVELFFDPPAGVINCSHALNSPLMSELRSGSLTVFGQGAVLDVNWRYRASVSASHEAGHVCSCMADMQQWLPGWQEAAFWSK